MVYGKEYSIIINCQEYDDEDNFVKALVDVCNTHGAVLFDKDRKVELNN